ncbi:MAG: hypothetical protein WCC90_00020 [Methylocella sp.]
MRGMAPGSLADCPACRAFQRRAGAVMLTCPPRDGPTQTPDGQCLHRAPVAFVERRGHYLKHYAGGRPPLTWDALMEQRDLSRKGEMMLARCGVKRGWRRPEEDHAS